MRLAAQSGDAAIRIRLDEIKTNAAERIPADGRWRNFAGGMSG
jgi:hypothetical protein